MFKLNFGFVVCGILTGTVLLYNFFTTLPDGKLHIYFCNVGQGDAAYIRFPDGRDMLVDGGPNDTGVLRCLGRHMSLFDRSIDVVVLTHPEKDHMNGLVAVLKRYHVTYFLHSNIWNTTEAYQSIVEQIHKNKVKDRRVYAGEFIGFGNVSASVLWPTRQQIAVMNPTPSSQVLGAVAPSNLNDGSVVVKLSYGVFDALLTGDADMHVDDRLVLTTGIDADGIEVLKVPHHGSKTGMSDGLLRLLLPSKNAKAVISVGKNSYGHPDSGLISELKASGYSVVRTDTSGDIEVITDGRSWDTRTQL